MSTNPNHIYLNNITIRWRPYELEVVEWINKSPYQIATIESQFKKNFPREIIYKAIEIYLEESPDVKVIYLIGNSYNLNLIRCSYND